MNAPHAIPFGKHKDRPLPEVPLAYLLWLARTCKLSSGLRAAVRDELVRRGIDPASLPPDRPSMRPTACRRCGGTELRLYWQELGGQGGQGGRTIRGDCARCGRFVAFQPQTQENVKAADATTSRTAMLDALQLADAEGVEVVNCHGRAVWTLPNGRASPRLEEMIRQSKRLLLEMLPRRDCGLGE